MLTKLIIKDRNGVELDSGLWDIDKPISKGTTVVYKDIEYIVDSISELHRHQITVIGRKVEFDIKRIENAIFRCFRSVDKSEEKSEKLAKELADQVYNIVCAKFEVPTVENIQDIVETVLQAAKEFDAAKKYILYRAEHAKMRMERPVPEEVKAVFEKSDEYFPTQLQKFQFYDKYARFNWDLGRRETWVETVDRAVNFLRELSEFRLPKSVYERIRTGILEMKIMPSMRLLAMAGPAARRNNICLYNCSYMPVDGIQSFV